MQSQLLATPFGGSLSDHSFDRDRGLAHGRGCVVCWSVQETQLALDIAEHVQQHRERLSVSCAW